jgi:hypothetical protein
MSELRKYGTLLVAGTTSIDIPMIKRGAVDFAVGADWTPVAGDVTVLVDAAGAANITNLPTAVTTGNGAVWRFILTAAELTSKATKVLIVDAASGKAVEDNAFLIETYGNASAMYAGDVSAAALAADLKSILGTALTESTTGYLAAAFKKLFDVTAPVLTAQSVNQTADAGTILTTPLSEPAVRTIGATGSLSQFMHEIISFLEEKSQSGSLLTTKKLDQSTTRAVYTLNSPTTPTSITRST